MTRREPAASCLCVFTGAAGMLRDLMRRAAAVLAAILCAHGRCSAIGASLCIGLLAAAQNLGPQLQDLADRPISAIRFKGLSRVPEQKVLNNIRAAVGEPFDPIVVQDDVERLNRLGEFKYVEAYGVLQLDGSVAVEYNFTEQQIIREVQVVGNKLISDQDLRAVVLLVPQGPRDDFLIEKAKRAIEDLYRTRGHYLTTVTIDEPELQKTGILIFKIIEGPRVKIRAVEFEGNDAFDDDKLYAEVKTRTAVFLIRKGELDEEVLADDVAALTRFYTDRGYMDVRVDRTIELSPDNTEAKVTFLLSEGRPYTLRSVQVTNWSHQPLLVFSPDQIAAIIELKTGDIYSYDKLRKSTRAIQEAYGLMGYLLSEDARQSHNAPTWDVFVENIALRVGEAESPQIDLLIRIDEGEQKLVGPIQINGNFLTKDKVVRREVRLNPGQPFDGTQIEKSRERLIRTRLFNDARITVQKEDPENPGYRDVLVEVKEANTGSVNFGVAVGSDSGLFGEISINQNNFDVTDYPESLHELITGRAFRGAGQRFSAALRPGTELFQYSMSLTEPHLLDTEYAGTAALLIYQRDYDDYDQEQYGGTLALSRQLGDIWALTGNLEAKRVHLTNIDPSAPSEIFRDAGPDTVTSIGVGLTRTTIDTVKRPGSGSRLELNYEYFGALGGAFDFSSVNADYTVYFTLSEDFLGRISTLKLNTRMGYEFGGGRVPTYERYYLGGRSLRGFEYRTVSPKGFAANTGLPTNDPVGGTWMFFAGAQYEFPILGDAITGVVFVDSGTVTFDPGFDEYRVAVGSGLRLYIPAFGELPIALDFGFPLLKQDLDEEQLFSFSAEFPF
jgi:outer membrane protein insertion porin family